MPVYGFNAQQARRIATTVQRVEAQHAAEAHIDILLPLFFSPEIGEGSSPARVV